MEVLIRGAGVAGLALAYELRKRGADVTLLEKQKDLVGSASWLAGGMLAPWCERESAEEEVLTFGRPSVEWWSEALPDQVVCKGTLVVAPPRDTSELARFAGRTSGYDWLEAGEIEDLEPDLAGRFSKALFFSGEAHLDPRKALLGLQQKLVDMGVRFEFGAKSTTDHNYLEANCTGMSANDPDLRGVRGEMLLLHAPEVTLSRPVRMLHPRIPVYIVPREDHHFMVGATMIESEDYGQISVRSTMELLNAAYSLHPSFGEAKIVETGTGVRPAYDDNLPRVTQKGRVVSVNGFYRHGYLLAPHFAGVAADRIINSLQEQDFETHH
ncbi:MAG: glycine oxidase ThiO [Roseibium sp.]|uniref:glycine oxidase ThiO n=1 Tax=Roseibium sp. TaxID=1936156 RepID=UPI00261E0B03|nr:glycine oxidase ThiO [Roseibium sp.]MCV0428208.1 glycine oxidase ThiO [Roseibium sp.]